MGEEVESWLASPSGIPFSDFKSVDKFLEQLGQIPPKPEEVIHYGQPFGALYEKSASKKIAPGALFNASFLSVEPRTRMWVELLETGTFTNLTLSRIPTSFEISPEWIKVLEEAIVQHSPGTWLHHLLLGTAYLEQGQRDRAHQSFTQSMISKPNVHAARNLAVIAPSNESQFAYYQEAWTTWLHWDASDPARDRLGRNFASEFSIWQTVNGMWDTLRPFLAELPKRCPGCWDADRVLDARASLAVNDQETETALKLLTSHCFPSYGGDRTRLIALWYQAHLQMETARLGRPMTRMDTVHLRRKIGCDGDSTTSTWKDPCMRGPPNLGIAY